MSVTGPNHNNTTANTNNVSAVVDDDTSDDFEQSQFNTDISMGGGAGLGLNDIEASPEKGSKNGGYTGSYFTPPSPMSLMTTPTNANTNTNMQYYLKNIAEVVEDNAPGNFVTHGDDSAVPAAVPQTNHSDLAATSITAPAVAPSSSATTNTIVPKDDTHDDANAISANGTAGVYDDVNTTVTGDDGCSGLPALPQAYDHGSINGANTNTEAAAAAAAAAATVPAVATERDDDINEVDPSPENAPVSVAANDEHTLTNSADSADIHNNANPEADSHSVPQSRPGNICEDPAVSAAIAKFVPAFDSDSEDDDGNNNHINNDEDNDKFETDALAHKYSYNNDLSVDVDPSHLQPHEPAPVAYTDSAGSDFTASGYGDALNASDPREADHPGPTPNTLRRCTRPVSPSYSNSQSFASSCTQPQPAAVPFPQAHTADLAQYYRNAGAAHNHHGAPALTQQWQQQPLASPRYLPPTPASASAATSSARASQPYGGRYVASSDAGASAGASAGVSVGNESYRAPQPWAELHAAALRRVQRVESDVLSTLAQTAGENTARTLAAHGRHGHAGAVGYGGYGYDTAGYAYDDPYLASLNALSQRGRGLLPASASCSAAGLARGFANAAEAKSDADGRDGSRGGLTPQARAYACRYHHNDDYNSAGASSNVRGYADAEASRYRQRSSVTAPPAAPAPLPLSTSAATAAGYATKGAPLVLDSDALQQPLHLTDKALRAARKSARRYEAQEQQQDAQQHQHQQQAQQRSTPSQRSRSQSRSQSRPRPSSSHPTSARDSARADREQERCARLSRPTAASDARASAQQCHNSSVYLNNNNTVAAVVGQRYNAGAGAGEPKGLRDTVIAPLRPGIGYPESGSAGGRGTVSSKKASGSSWSMSESATVYDPVKGQAPVEKISKSDSSAHSYNSNATKKNNTVMNV